MNFSLFLIQFFLLLSFTFPCLAQTDQTQRQSFIPQGWFLKKSAEGDLNGDHINDAVLILSPDAEKNEEAISETPRELQILFGNPDQSWKVSAKSQKIILCKSCGGMMGEPFQSVSIEKGVIIINHAGGSRERWSLTHRLRFQNQDWYLIGKTYESSDTLSPESSVVDMNLLTGDKIVEKTSAAGKKTVTKRKLASIKPIKLSDFDIDKDLSDQSAE